ncbi:unnamed protein product [Leptosia nina]|uniref:Uncharacterized protein n=1 Tax=Leptosia nina TaxID=320188 RepID=A0AAV1K3N7_9NEOP
MNNYGGGSHDDDILYVGNGTISDHVHTAVEINSGMINMRIDCNASPWAMCEDKQHVSIKCAANSAGIQRAALATCCPDAARACARHLLTICLSCL